MLSITTGWLVPSILGHHGCPIFKGWMSSEEYCKRWLAQRYLLDTHPHWPLPEHWITSPYFQQTCCARHLGMWVQRLLLWVEPHDVLELKSTNKMMGTARSRFDGCLNPPVRTTKPSEKPTSVAFHPLSRQMTASSTGTCPGGTSKGFMCHPETSHLPPSCGGWSDWRHWSYTTSLVSVAKCTWVWDEDEIARLAYVSQTAGKICSG